MNFELLHPQSKELWYKQNAENLRYNYNLNENSRVLDIGSCIGDFIKEIHSKFNCFVDGYEPVKAFYDQSLVKIGHNSKIRIFNSAISNINSSTEIEFEYDGSKNKAYSFDIGTGTIIENKIDLLKINIEGYEYSLLDRLCDTKIHLVDNIQVQFHILNQDCFYKRYLIQQKLAKTHKLDWSYEFVWESWSLK